MVDDWRHRRKISIRKLLETMLERCRRRKGFGFVDKRKEQVEMGESKGCGRMREWSLSDGEGESNVRDETELVETGIGARAT